MNLDRSFFENIRMESVRGKFYRKQEVDALIKEIESKAEITLKDNEILNLKLENIERKIQQLGDVNDAARGLAQDIVAEANTEAESILSSTGSAADAIMENAKKEAEKIISEAESRRDAIISEACKKRDELMEKMTSAWQGFLEESENLGEGESALPEAVHTEQPPEDLVDRLEEIARTMTEIDEEDN